MDDYFDLNPQTYEWCVRIFDRAKHLLGVHIKMHHDQGQAASGDIFLFNHFARAETFIPQYFIYEETAAFCRSIAAAEFFRGSERFANFLRDVGAVPNDQPNLLAMLALDILKGRKIVIFPEGGMVKDRQVINEEGDYSVFSRHAQVRRKHHSGAARLAFGLQVFKLAVLDRIERSRDTEIAQWADELNILSVEQLIENAARPVTIIPANITFYPLRISDNFLRRGAELLIGDLSPRALEEIIVEGNLFFKNTDMDIRLGDPISTPEHWTWWERHIGGITARRLPSLEAVFSSDYLRSSVFRRLARRGVRASIHRLRNRYMRDIYQNVTINMSHLASCGILNAMENGAEQISLQNLARIIYLSLKRLQGDRAVHLHRSLCNPDTYQQLLSDEPPELLEFLASASSADLIELRDANIFFRPKLAVDHEFDAIRLENPVEVYANETDPIPQVRTAIHHARETMHSRSPDDYARLAFDDELWSLIWDRQFYRDEEHQAINDLETAHADPAPFLFVPERTRRIGIVLTHGFLASPAEVRDFGEKLQRLGYLVVAPRLKGHGTSPWDLRERSWQDWQASVRRAHNIASTLTERVALIGFSTGGALSLSLAAEPVAKIAGIVAISSPIKFRNKNLRFVPLMHSANRIVRWVSKYEGVMPFRPNDSEHPHINYRHMPIRALYELTRMVATVKKSLKDVHCPVCIVQGTEDHVVDPISATIMETEIAATHKELHWIDTARHGILNEDIGTTHRATIEFLANLEAEETSNEDAAVVALDGRA